MEVPPSPHYLACPDCDGLFTAPQVGEGERVICQRCGAKLFSRRPNFVHRATALIFAAGFFFVLANAFPFLTLQADYRQSDMVLAGAVSGLQAEGFSALATIVAIFILAAPGVLIGALLYVNSFYFPLRQLAAPPWRLLQVGCLLRWVVRLVGTPGALDRGADVGGQELRPAVELHDPLEQVRLQALAHVSQLERLDRQRLQLRLLQREQR